jgi:HD superfamily phosphohydrolase
MDFVRDPLWNNIRLDDTALALLETAVVQRLRYVRQLGLAFLVYPGATHSRFEHALGTHHLARTALRHLGERGELAAVDPREPALVRVAALLHDVGHYPYSHALEEIGVPDHEEVARRLLGEGPVAEILVDRLGPDAPAAVHALVAGRSRGALATLISGSLDLDKLEYLKRDALMCGVPYGEIDVDRLLHSLVVVEAPDGGAAEAGAAAGGSGRGPADRPSASSRRGSPRSSRCSLPSTRCTATCTGTTPSGARRRCTSDSWRRR